MSAFDKQGIVNQSDDDLCKIMKNQDQYLPEVVELARSELVKRNVSLPKIETCSKCGIKYWSDRELDEGLCNKCHSRREAGKQAEAKRQTEVEARLKEGEEAGDWLPRAFVRFVPGENTKVLGAAYWDNLSSAVGTLKSKLAIGMLLGGFGMALTGKEHRAGILAVTDTHLFVVDLGTVLGEEITLKKLSKVGRPTSVKKVSLENVTAECDTGAGILTLKGELNLKAVFPESFEERNPSKAAIIAKIIRSGS
jgi:hypothetical protein